MRVPDAAALLQVFHRGRRLWRSNPNLFYDRLWSYMRSPTWGIHELIETPKRSRRIQEAYDAWLACRDAGVRVASTNADGPLLSVIMPVFDTPQNVLSAAIESVLGQTYPYWELCIADDASTAAHVRPLLGRYAAKDPRILVIPRSTQGHISAASNTAIDHARGEFVVLLDHDDVLAPNALAEVVEVVRQDPAVDFIYSDEDKFDFDGTRVEPFFKPAWSPTLLSCGNYITHLAVMRRTVVLEVGGFRDELVGSQDHDLFLRVTERARAVAHIPQVLYSWRKSPTSTAVATTAKPYAIQAAQRALQDAINRRGIDATLQPLHLNGLFMAQPRFRVPARVSLIVRGSPDGWMAALDSTEVELCEVTTIGRDATAESVAHAIQQGTGDTLLFVDAEEYPSSEASVGLLLASAQRIGAGVSSGMTVDHRTGTILQAGIAFGTNGQPFYAYAGSSPFPQRNFYLNLKDIPREVSAGHLGSSAMPRALWQALGGWSSQLPVQLAWYDLCLRVLEAGYDNVYAPAARFETARPLPPILTVTDHAWNWHTFGDPFWNPNLSPGSAEGLPFRCNGIRDSRIRAGSALTMLGPGAGIAQDR